MKHLPFAIDCGIFHPTTSGTDLFCIVNSVDAVHICSPLCNVFPACNLLWFPHSCGLMPGSLVQLSFHMANPGIHLAFLCWLHLSSAEKEIQRAVGDKRQETVCSFHSARQLKRAGQGNPLHHRKPEG